MFRRSYLFQPIILGIHVSFWGASGIESLFKFQRKRLDLLNKCRIVEDFFLPEDGFDMQEKRWYFTNLLKVNRHSEKTEPQWYLDESWMVVNPMVGLFNWKETQLQHRFQKTPRLLMYSKLDPTLAKSAQIAKAKVRAFWGDSLTAKAKVRAICSMVFASQQPQQATKSHWRLERITRLFSWSADFFLWNHHRWWKFPND